MSRNIVFQLLPLAPLICQVKPCVKPPFGKFINRSIFISSSTFQWTHKYYPLIHHLFLSIYKLKHFIYKLNQFINSSQWRLSYDFRTSSDENSGTIINGIHNRNSEMCKNQNFIYSNWLENQTMSNMGQDYR